MGNLKVATARDAVKLMCALLQADMLDNDLEIKSGASAKDENLEYVVRLCWFYRNGIKVGCPCFVCRFMGAIAHESNTKAFVYVKAFASRNPNMTKMCFKKDGAFLEIKDGERFTMDDGRSYIYENGCIREV